MKIEIKSIFGKALLLLLLALFGGQAVYAQGITIKGKVSDDKEPLMGVTIQVKGTSKATATDLDGNYTITVPDKKSVLVFS